MALTNQNSIHEEIKSRLKSGNACYHLMQTLVFQFAIQKCKAQVILNYNLPAVLYRHESWSLMWRGESRLRVFGNRALRTFRPIKDEVTGVEKTT
jgi:hypothetical protein